jgi:hypothetical protein
MGTRDFRHHEPKKPRKGAKKPLVSEVLLSAPPAVEVIKAKGKKEKKEWWEEKGTEEEK